MKIDLSDLKDKPKARDPSRKRKPKFNRKVMVSCACAVLVGAAVIGSITAYQTDADQMINKFTIGHVEIEAYEPNFPTKDTDEGRVPGVPDECELMTPFKTIPKDPYIKNTGKNDCVVFFRITVPAEVMNLVNDDGTRVKNTEEDLFWLKVKDAPDDEHKNSFNPNWVRLTSLDGKLVDCEGVNDEGRGKTYIFGYHTRLKPTETTTTLFDKIQNKKYGSRTIGPDEIEQIKVESFAIQADEVKRAGIDVPTDGKMNEEDLTYIYKVFINQNENTVGKGDWRNE